MTQARPKGASTGRLLLDQLVDRVPGREVVGHDHVDGQMHSVDERRLAGRGLGGERRPSRQEAGHRGAGRSGGVYEEIRNPSLIAVTASGITHALCAGVRSRGAAGDSGRHARARRTDRAL